MPLLATLLVMRARGSSTVSASRRITVKTQYRRRPQNVPPAYSACNGGAWVRPGNAVRAYSACNAGPWVRPGSAARAYSARNAAAGGRQRRSTLSATSAPTASEPPTSSVAVPRAATSCSTSSHCAVSRPPHETSHKANPTSVEAGILFPGSTRAAADPAPHLIR